MYLFMDIIPFKFFSVMSKVEATALHAWVFKLLLRIRPCCFPICRVLYYIYTPAPIL